MTGKDAAQTTLEEWLAQHPAPEPTATAPAIPTDEIEEAARFFGFDPNDLTWGYNYSGRIVTVLGGVSVRFDKLSNDKGGSLFAVVDDHGLMDTPLMLAEYIRDKQAEDVKEEAYANRTRVMTVMVLPLDMREAEAFATISHLCNHEGWKIFSVYTEHSQRAWVQIYTLTRD